MRIVALAGALRKGSYNAKLARACAARAPAGHTIEVATIEGVPLYDGDVEARDGVPPAVARLKDMVAAADGLIIVTPEYNNGIPGVTKNAIDWMSRPPADMARVFKGKPVGLMGATPGPGGTRLSQAAWLPVLRQLGTQPWFGSVLYVDSAAKVFDDAGEIVDPKIVERLERYLEGFMAYAATFRAQASAPNA